MVLQRRSQLGIPTTEEASSTILAPECGTQLSEHMLDCDLLREILRVTLSNLSGFPVRITQCRAKPIASRRNFREKRRQVIYTVRLEVPGRAPREVLLLATSPVPEGFLQDGLLDRGAAIRANPEFAPFTRAVTYVANLKMAIQIFPLDLALPGLLEATGPRAIERLAPHVPECREGGAVSRLSWSVPDARHYLPGNRCMLKFEIEGITKSGKNFGRTLFAKMFSNQRGARSFAALKDVWRGASGSRHLHVPEPLGYDPDLRMLVMAKAPGEKHLAAWIKCLERQRELPVDFDHVKRAVAGAARALAGLQRSALQPKAHRFFRDELAHLRMERDMLFRARPSVVAPADRVLNRLEAHCPGAETLVPSHGAFRHTQILTQGDRHTIFDWDSFRRASGAADAATFLVRLRKIPVLRPGAGAAMNRLATHFRREFLVHCPEVRPDAVLLYEALKLVDQALRAFRKPGSDREAMRRGAPLLAEAARILDLLALGAHEPAPA